MNFSNFAKRFDPGSGILQLMNDLGYAVNQGEDLCMLGGGNPAVIPDMESCFRSEMELLMQQGRDFEKLIGNYDAPQGNQKFIFALANLLNEEFDWPVDEKNIAITNGSQSSFGTIFNLLAGQYEDGSVKQILLPMTPEYIGYADVGLSDLPLFLAKKPVIQFDEQDSILFKYRVDFENLDVTEKLGGVCISRPTNPTGNVITDNELSKLNRICKTSGIPLIIDGAYGLPFPGIVFNDVKPIWDEHIITCLSLSKLGMPGVRTGIVIANEDLIKIISGSNAISSLAPGGFGPALVSRLIESRELLQLCKKNIKPFYLQKVKRTLDIIRSRMKNLPVKVHKPEGAMFLWLWFQDFPIPSEQFYQILKKRGVFVISGHHFFPGFTGDWPHRHECIRISYAGDSAKVEKGLKIIAEVAARVYDSPANAVPQL